jgi:hypothetical protein
MPTQAKTSRPLSERIVKFVSTYAATLNATQAAIAAGYSAKSASQAASRLLRDAKVAAAIAAFTENSKRDTIMSAVERHEFWSRVARGHEPEAEMKDRLKAAELLGKVQGDFIERLHVTNGGQKSLEEVIAESNPYASNELTAGQVKALRSVK